MTNERAIELLNRISDSQFDGEYGDERREALEMAVRALEQNLVQESGGLVKDLVKDCISRKMAIDAIKSYWKNEVDRIPKKSTNFDVFTQICDSILSHNANICKAIDKLPPAQPETHDKRTETHACDLINREQAIDAVKDLPNCRNGFSDTYDKACIIGVLEDLPTAQPQWIPFAEMMPAFGESVLVQFDDDDMDILTFPNIYKRLKRVAWMPLPKPYGGESE